MLHVFSLGIHEGWTSIYLPELLNGTNTAQITSEEGSWITSFLFVGAIMGCGISAITINLMGRKITILITSAAYCISSLMLAFARSVTIFYVARFTAGVASGMTFTAVPFHLGEIADPKFRGFLQTFYIIFGLCGFLFISVLGSCLNVKLSSLILAGIPIVHLVIFVWMPESPYYLIKKEDFEKAKQSLKKFKGDINVEEELNRLNEAIRAENEDKSIFLELFTNKLHRRTRVQYIFWFFNVSYSIDLKRNFFYKCESSCIVLMWNLFVYSHRNYY
ncbi:Sugar tr and/or MFS 1 domain containing protein, partial [Asbolus verrucosus]